MDKDQMLQELLCSIDRNPEPVYLENVLTYAACLEKATAQNVIGSDIKEEKTA